MKKAYRIFTFLLLLLPLSGAVIPGYPEPVTSAQYPEIPPFLGTNNEWADSIMDKLSLEEKIAQMIMIPAYSNRGEDHVKDVKKLINRHRVGGIAFFQGDPLTQALYINEFQDASRVPLLVAIDGETGLGMRLKNTIKYPAQMALGAIDDNSLIYDMGMDIARQMKRAGVHMNFAPVADINNNPSNPVINTRSFGEVPDRVSSKVISFMQGMQDGGLLVTAKHFPGHGDTDTDSHYALPVIPFSRERLDSVELHPFREAINRGLTGIMVAHLQVPAIDDRQNRPTTVSSKAIRGVLKDQLGFRGLVITDAMNMKGLSSFFGPGQVDVEAVKAGNDILLMPADAERAISEIKKAVRRGEISKEDIDKSCRKILQAKYWAGLKEVQAVDTTGLVEELNSPEYRALNRKLMEKSLVLARNEKGLLPLRDLANIRLATLTLGESDAFSHAGMSDLYLEGSHFQLTGNPEEKEQLEVLDQLDDFNTLIINVLNTSAYASRKYGISPECIEFIGKLPPEKNVILNLAGYPYALRRFGRLENVDAVLLSCTDSPLYQAPAIQAIFGGISLNGKLPVQAGKIAPAGGGFSTPAFRLSYGRPMDVNLRPDTLLKMDSIIYAAIGNKSTPGCQLLLARNGRVVLHRAYGHHTYRGERELKLSDLYDLASITKISATLPSLMLLRDRGLFHEDSLLGSYYHLARGYDKDSLKIGDILAHQAGLQSWIPFYYKTLEPLDSSERLFSNNLSSTYALKIGPSAFANRNTRYVDSSYSSSWSPEFPRQVAENLFMDKAWVDTLYRTIHESGLLKAEYRYSDLGYYMLQKIVETSTDTMLYPFAWYHFYQPLGAHRLGFLPLNRFERDEIVPTENDLFFRRQLLQGHVHDPGAAMLGGIAGHAGLFGNANDLAKMMQMYLNGGSYGGDSYIDPATLVRYTSCYDCENENRRGLGFDRPVVEEPGEGPACDSASALSFGHSGFTGTIAWADPSNGMLFIFLSNRIHPDASNTRLIEDNVRTKLQQVAYDAIIK